MTHPWPFLTATAPIAGVYKARPEDFVVEEVPAYAPSGEGEHVLFEIEKRGLSTHEVVSRIARSLGVAPPHIGYAGLKDAQGVTRQWLSVQGVDIERVRTLELRDVLTRSAAPHKNKLRVGHLRGNRFVIKLRDVPEEQHSTVASVLDELSRRGAPNYFGEQRFGVRGDTWRIGRALLLGEHMEAVAWLVGRPGPTDFGKVRRARELFDAGEWERAAETWPGGFRANIRVCRALAKAKGDARRALYSLDRSLLRFYTSAYQSWLFNAVLAQRVSEVDRVLEGDLAWLHRNGAVFVVKDLAIDAPRAERLEISASGPLFGVRMTSPLGVPLELERRVLETEGHALEAFTRPGPHQWQGGRRPLRFPLSDASCASGSDEHGGFVELRFTAPPGCYATAALREIFKRDDIPSEDPLSAETTAAESAAPDVASP